MRVLPKNNAHVLKDKIQRRSAQVGVIGLGYVGLPLAVAFAEAGFEVTGIDVDPRKVASINAGRNYIPDIPDRQETTDT